MDYNLKIGQETKTLEVNELDGERQYAVTIDGETANISVSPVSPNLALVKIGEGNFKRVYVAQSDQGLWVWIDGKVRLVADADSETSRRSSGEGQSKEPTEVTPVTPSTVVSVLAEVGQQVAKGDKMVVVSAMKMETTLTAPFSGTVKAVNVAEGDKVMPGEILVDIEPAASEE